MSAALNKNCALVRRLGQPAYESCRSCELHLQNCIQFRGQLYTIALVLLVLAGAFLPVPTWARGVMGAVAVGVLFHFLRYVRRESHTSIITAARLRVERTQAVASARALDENIKKLEETRDQLVRADKLAAVGTLAAGVAHEINNPLAFMLSNLRFVREELDGGAVEADVVAALREAEAGGERVRRIVADLKVLARDEKASRQRVELKHAMQQVVTLARNEIRHVVTLVEHYEDAPPVLGDPGKLGQVFLNLVVNALQAMPARPLAENRLELRVRRDGPHVVAEVCDSGEGIAPEHLPHLFDPFFTTKPAGVGTGLGLAICQTLVQSMGGALTVSSVPGQGTTFRVVLPVATEAELDLADGPLQPRAPLVSRRRGRILVVDDEPMVASTIERMLRKEHDVVCSDGGRAALVQLQKDSAFDLLLCDLMMPDLTGAEFHQELQVTNVRLAARTIFMTGGAFTPLTRAFLETTQNPLIEKPFDEDRLRDLVCRWVNDAA